MIRHPCQDHRAVVTTGQYAGRGAKVIGLRRELTNGAGDYFVEIEFDAPNGSKKKGHRNLVPSRYLDHDEATS